MGIFTQVKADTVAKHATRARDEGRTVLVLRVNMPNTAPEGTPISGIAEQIEAVEAQGWRLDKLGNLGDKGVALFRRA